MNPSTHRAACAMDAIVEGPIETIEKALNVEPFVLIFSRVLRKTSEDQFLLVSDGVVVRVFEIPDIRRRADEDAAVVTDHCRRPGQPFGKNGALIKVTIAVRVFEQSNASEPFIATLRIIAHLNDVEPAVFVEGH